MKFYPKGVFNADVISFRKKDGRYFLHLEICDEKSTRIFIDVHDSICETAGIYHISPALKEKIFRNFPSSIKVSNIDGYWEIPNENELFSNVLAKAL